MCSSYFCGSVCCRLQGQSSSAPLGPIMNGLRKRPHRTNVQEAKAGDCCFLPAPDSSEECIVLGHYMSPLSGRAAGRYCHKPDRTVVARVRNFCGSRRIAPGLLELESERQRSSGGERFGVKLSRFARPRPVHRGQEGHGPMETHENNINGIRSPGRAATGAFGTSGPDVCRMQDG